MAKVLITGYSNDDRDIDMDYCNALLSHSSVSSEGNEWRIHTTNGEVGVTLDVDKDGDADFASYDYIVYVYDHEDPYSLSVFIEELEEASDSGKYVYLIGLYDEQPRQVDRFFLDNLEHRSRCNNVLTSIVRDIIDDDDLELVDKPVPPPPEPQGLDVDKEIRDKLVELLKLLVVSKQ